MLGYGVERVCIITCVFLPFLIVSTHSASIGSISSLLGVWLVVFAVYGIMFAEIFGLTSYGPNGGDHVNFRNIGASLLMMARMSTG